MGEDLGFFSDFGEFLDEAWHDLEVIANIVHVDREDDAGAADFLDAGDRAFEITNHRISLLEAEIL